MDDKQIVAQLRRQINAARDDGPDQGQLKKAMDYYYGRPRGDEVPGRSQVQSLDVADMTHAVMAQILPSFTQDSVCQFEPDGPDDEAMARLESDAVNKVMMESSRGYVVFYEALKDALLLKNGIVKGYLDETDGQRRIRLDAVDPLGFLVGADQSCILLDSYRTSFCAERKEYLRGDLVDMGLPRDKVAEVPEGDDDGTEVSYARSKRGQDAAMVQAGWANERVTIWECYARIGDGSSVDLYRCLLGGQTLLLKERVDSLPYAAGSPFPEPHKFWGLSLYDRLKTVQDAKTAIQRQWLDNLANCNNSQTAINDMVNLEDMEDSRPGGLKRVKGMTPPSEAIMPLPVLDAGPAAQAYLAYMDQVRADRGGAALQMANAELQTMGAQVGSQGVDRIFSVQEQMAGMIARTLAETLLRSAFMLVHRLLRTEYGEPLQLRLADQWVQVDPSQWKVRDRVNIKSGLSPGERSRKAAAMAGILQYQQSTMQMGLDGIMVTLPNIYNALLDWCSSQELEAGEKYFTDPRSQQAQQGSQQKAQGQQQQQQQEQQLQQMQMQLAQSQLQLDKYKADQDTQFNYWKERLSAEIEEAKLIGAATQELNRIELEGRFAATQGASQGSGANGAGSGPG
jgi:hypothetical protein